MRFYSLLLLSLGAAVVMACPEREEDPTEVDVHGKADRNIEAK